MLLRSDKIERAKKMCRYKRTNCPLPHPHHLLFPFSHSTLFRTLRVFVCLSASDCLDVRLSVSSIPLLCLSVCPSVCLPLCLCLSLSVSVSVCLSVTDTSHRSACLSVSFSLCLSLCVCLFVSLSLLSVCHGHLTQVCLSVCLSFPCHSGIQIYFVSLAPSLLNPLLLPTFFPEFICLPRLSSLVSFHT